MDLQSSLYKLAGIGPNYAKKLERLNLFTVEDLINHYPLRYDDYSKISSVSDAKIGEKVTIQGEIWSIKNVYTRFGKILTQAIFNDGTAPVTLTWFNSSWLTKLIKPGDRLQVSGKLSKYKNKLSIVAPAWEKAEGANLDHPPGGTGIHTGRLVPVYSETYGVSSKWLRTKIDTILPQVLGQVVDPLPNEVADQMISLPLALSQIHFPNSWQEVEKAKERLSFDELFFIQLATLKTRADWQKKPIVEKFQIPEDKFQMFINKLPFTLTNAQQRVIEEIIKDLRKDQPMNRLIQGEVGSGKTVVAAIAAYLTHTNGLRTLYMAPTEILAFQHYETLSNLLSPFGIEVGIYTGSKKHLRGGPDVIVGTHALLSPKLTTEDVGLVIVDEQQRFGVEQRSFLRSRAKVPHFLTMTATPIPRTVALTLYGDLDLSIIDELPKGRPKINTYLVPERKRADAYQFIRKKVKEGDQVYIITPLIEQSETLQSVKAVKVEFEKLTKQIFPDLKLGLLHGKLKSREKEQAIGDFKNKKIDILVSTSVVEVGMDIPNATIMVIEGAERFGLAQLHQLRGRVGRGTKESHCLLYTSNVSSEERGRLKHLETTFDGLKLAELDLKIRGSGEIFGTKQAGRFELKIASFSDLSLIEKTREAARKILEVDPTLDKYPSLKAKLSSLASVMPD